MSALSQNGTAPLAILDPQQLEMMTGGDAALASEVIEIFLHQADIWSRLLDAREAASRWADAAHTLKGSALSVGAMQLAEACRVAEALGRSDTPTVAQAAVALSEVKDRLGEAREACAYLAHELTSSGTFSLSKLSNS